MSNAYLNAVWAMTAIGRGDAHVLAALADRANDAGVCWPSIGDLATRTKMTERGVRKILRRLLDAGLITMTEGGGRHVTNRYALTFPPLASAKDYPEVIHNKGDTAQVARDQNPERRSQNPERGSLNPERRSAEPLRTQMNLSASEARPVDTSRQDPQRQLPDLATRQKLSAELLGRTAGKLKPGPRLTEDPPEDRNYLQ